MANIVEILIKAKDQASQVLKDVAGSFDDINKKSGEAKEGTADFATSWQTTMIGINQGLEAARKVAQAIEAAYDFAVEAAALERLETASHTMAESVGMDMDDIVESVKAASLGMVSESDIMASASRAMMLGVGSNAEELAALMETAAIRGQAMGVSTEQAFNDIVTGIGRQSRMILDNLGIVLDLEQVYADYALSVGKSVDDLEDFEKKQAMVNAVLEDTQDLLDTTGGLVLDNMGQWEKLGAQYEDYMDSVKKGTSGPLAELAKMLNVHLGEWNLDKNFKDLKAQLKEAGMDVEEFDEAWKDNQNFMGWVKDQEYAMQLLKDYEQALDNQKNAARNAAEVDLGYYADMAAMATIKTKDHSDALSIAALEMDRFDYEIQGANESIEEFNKIDAFALQAKRTEKLLGFSEDYQDTQDEIAKKQAEINVLMTGFTLDGEQIDSEDAAARINEIEGEILDLTASSEQAIKDMNNNLVLDMAQAIILADEKITEQEYLSFLELQTDLGVITEETAAEMYRVMKESVFDKWDGWQPSDKSAQLVLDVVYAQNRQGMIMGSEGGIQIDTELDEDTGLLGGMTAAGGPIYAAAGMPVAPYWVGEVGPEPMFPAQDGRILSNSQAMSAMRSAGGKSPTVVNVTINTPLNLADRVWVETELAPYIRDVIDRERL